MGDSNIRVIENTHLFTASGGNYEEKSLNDAPILFDGDNYSNIYLEKLDQPGTKVSGGSYDRFKMFFALNADDNNVRKYLQFTYLEGVLEPHVNTVDIDNASVFAVSHPSSIVTNFDSARFDSVRNADGLLIRIENDPNPNPDPNDDKIYFTYHTGNFAISMESKNNLDDGTRSNHNISTLRQHPVYTMVSPLHLSENIFRTPENECKIY